MIFGTNLDWCKPAEVMFIFFTRKDILQWSKKITKQSRAILEPTQKVSAFYDQCALRSDTPKLVVFKRGITTSSCSGGGGVEGGRSTERPIRRAATGHFRSRTGSNSGNLQADPLFLHISAHPSSQRAVMAQNLTRFGRQRDN